MRTTVITKNDDTYPDLLRRVAKPPESLFVRGAPLPTVMSRPRLAVVGSRAITPYGKYTVEALVRPLAERGIVIISGLAYGVDAAAHRAALNGGGLTMAVLPSPVETPAPIGNRRLAEDILSGGGTLISSYEEISDNYRFNFVERNQYVSALSDALLVVEGALGSGTARTVDFAIQQGVPVLAVPGNINSSVSALPNHIIRTGCPQVLSAQDVLHELGIGVQLTLDVRRGDTADEQALLDLIAGGIDEGHRLLARSGLDVSAYNHALTMLEISGKIRPLGANRWGLG